MDGMTINHIVSIDHGSCIFGISKYTWFITSWWPVGLCFPPSSGQRHWWGGWYWLSELGLPCVASAQPPALFLRRSRRWSAKPDNDLKVRGVLKQRASISNCDGSGSSLNSRPWRPMSSDVIWFWVFFWTVVWAGPIGFEAFGYPYPAIDDGWSPMMI